MTEHEQIQRLIEVALAEPDHYLSDRLLKVAQIRATLELATQVRRADHGCCG